MATTPPVLTSSTTAAPAFALVNPAECAVAIASRSDFSATAWTSRSIVSSTSLPTLGSACATVAVGCPAAFTSNVSKPGSPSSAWS